MPYKNSLQFLKQLLQLLPLLFLALQVGSLPLSTSGRWIVDASTGSRVKLRCVNWAAHMPAMLAEGLDRQPLSGIAASVASLGFNCVRLTWATYMFTREHYENLTVAESMASLGLDEAAEGIKRNNPSMLGLTVREACDVIVGAIGDAGLMVVLDNHVSRPQWCCRSDDGNGFFGDLYFDPEEWLRGLDTVAQRFRGKPQVVGMSMRNELRGPNQSEPVWHRNVLRGARRIHEANPDVLIIVSGLSYDTDLSFLRRHPLRARFDGKLVLEAHWYAFSEGKQHQWADQNPDYVCSETARRFDERVGFVARGENETVPLFISEFGVDQRGTNRADNRFLSCFLAFAAERDLDWALWTLQGSYYLRNGRAGFEETYGVLDTAWQRPKDPKFRERYRLIQETIQDPRSSSATYQIIYHPHSGLCVWVDEDRNVLLNDCKKRSQWNHDGDGTPIQLLGANFCLKLAGEGLPLLLSDECTSKQSVWTAASGLGFQIAAIDAEGNRKCLGRESSMSSSILTRECTCTDNSTCYENTQAQWFKLIMSNAAYL